MVIGFEEGNFVRFYEHSAWILSVTQGLKPSKRIFKNVGIEIVSVGFPQTSLGKYIPNGLRRDDGVWEALVSIPQTPIFEEWKASVPLTVPERKGEPEITVEKLSSVSGLPVYKACYDLLLYVMQLGANMGRELRFSVGEDFKRRLIDVELCIYRANKAMVPDRIAHVERAREHLEESLIYLRLLYDMRQLALAQYAHAAELAAEVEKQLSNWYRSLGTVD